MNTRAAATVASAPAAGGETPRALPRVITIDGPAGVGKPSVAEEIAERIGYHIYDTGALYRAATLLAIRANIETVTPDSEPRLVGLIEAADIRVGVPENVQSEPAVTINGEDVTAHLRTPAVNRLVSPVSQLRGVRDALMAVQRTAAAAGGVIMVGRDMGTIIVPDADLKFYFDADVRVRAERRAKQLAERGQPRPFAEIEREEAERDRIDSSRAIAPLRPAPDAIHINTEGALADVLARVTEEIARWGDAPAAVTSPEPPRKTVRAVSPPAPSRSPAQRDERDRLHPILRTRWYRGYIHTVRYLVQALLMPIARIRVRGVFPRELMHGPMIVVCNHLNNFDPLIVGAYLPRNSFYMAKQELFPIPVLGGAIRTLGTFPIDRGGADRAALRYAIHLLEDGESLGMFPEGTRSKTHQIEKVSPGAAFIAVKTGATILPVALTGSELLPFKQKGGRVQVTLTIGEPFHLAPGANGKRPDLAAATDEIMRHIAVLLPPAYRGVYGDAGDSA